MSDKTTSLAWASTSAYSHNSGSTTQRENVFVMAKRPRNNGGSYTSPAGPSTRHPTPSITGGSTNSHCIVAQCRRSTESTHSTNNDQQEATEESESEEHVLSVYSRSGKLGAAYYTIQTGELFILDEIVDRGPEFQMFLNLYRQVQPNILLLDGKTQGSFVSTVKRIVFDNDKRDEGTCKLVFVSAREYSFEACKRRIFSLSLPNEPLNCSDEERGRFLRTVVDFSQTQSVHAMGALLRYLDLNWTNMNMDMQTKPQFLNLRKISLADIVTIDQDTYKGLQIFSSVSHPSNFKTGVQGSNKEGLSLFHVFSKCSSKVGHARMRVLLQHPSSDLALLRSRQEVVAFFMKPQNDSLMRNICSSLRFIKNVNGIMTKIKALSTKPCQWKSLYNTLYNAVLICEMCDNADPGKSCEFLQQLAGCDNNKLYEVASYMNRIIDFDLSKSEGKFTVKPGVDAELDMKKQTMSSLHGLMSETAKVELSRLPDFISECAMLYMPHLGYLLAVKAWADDLTMEQKTLPDMRFMFQNNDNIHYKSKGCEELDTLIGDTYPEIVAHETRIMMRLTTLILDNLHTLAAVVDKCAELDCLISISKLSMELNFVQPTLTSDKVISIKQGKHPLHMMTCDNFVPNDTESSKEAGYVKILTGPNSSGKSVYMKQIGLIVYLSQIGSFVPAESATIGVVSHIFTRIQSTECVAAHMSAFLIDLRQMALALQESTSNSLLIIDEFGKGTSETDGLSLLAASLNTLLFQGDACPHVFLSTHFLNIKEYIVNSSIARFLRFDHVLETGCPVFLFRLCEGTTEKSFAGEVAAAAGIDKGIVDTAARVMECIAKNIPPPENKKITAKLRAYTEVIKNELLIEDI